MKLLVFTENLISFPLNWNLMHFRHDAIKQKLKKKKITLYP